MTDTQTDFDFLPLRVIGKTADGKNRYDRAGKRKLIEACQKPGASVAGLALKAGVNANQLRKWICIERKKTRSRPER
jgi:transposase